MKDKIHIILAEEEGKVRSFAFSKKKLKKYICLLTVIFFFLSVASIVGINGLADNCSLRCNLASLKSEAQQFHEEKNALQLRVAKLEQEMHIKETKYAAEKQALIDGPINQLQEKNELIHQVLSQVGFNLAEKASGNGIGGPYIPVSEDSPEAIIYKAEKLLESLHFIPLGFPVSGHITSNFGIRRDPFTNKLALHEGIDIQNSLGTKIFATADGFVSDSGYESGYGRYLVIDHKNGFLTKYAHLNKSIVQQGDAIKRGDLLGLLGNSGRTTGSHLHYEIRYDDKPFNPFNFMNIADKVKKTTSIESGETNEIF